MFSGAMLVSCQDDSDPVDIANKELSLSHSSYSCSEETKYEDDVVKVTITETNVLSFNDDTNAVLRTVTEVVDELTGEKISMTTMDLIGTYKIVNYTVEFHISKMKVTADGQEESSDTNIIYKYSFDPSLNTLFMDNKKVLEKVPYQKL